MICSSKIRYHFNVTALDGEVDESTSWWSQCTPWLVLFPTRPTFSKRVRHNQFQHVRIPFLGLSSQSVIDPWVVVEVLLKYVPTKWPLGRIVTIYAWWKRLISLFASAWLVCFDSKDYFWSVPKTHGQVSPPPGELCGLINLFILIIIIIFVVVKTMSWPAICFCVYWLNSLIFIVRNNNNIIYKPLHIGSGGLA